ncbi:TonB-dependent receptor [Granulicella rosea]|uniref:TonB-dependent receptor n=1 Tax=Granulicella rosea TaxID=474952 RepID=UPI001FE77D1D|nr:TonB-dependent receptor [Granulicella rosea]
MLTLLLALGVATRTLEAQTGGEAGIQGTVVDSTGAAIPGASVTATNDATGVTTTRETSGSGLFTISPIIPGVYTVNVKATGFQGYTQKNFNIDALKLTGLNITMKLGESSTEITVDAAPPALETTNAVLGAVMENSTYENLPLQMNGQQRDPTAFAVLTPGVQSGSRAPIIGGTGNYLASVYVDGIPVTTVNQQGDNRVVSNAIPVEAIDQFQVVTSTPAAEYQGAGLINFTLKSGGSGYHGTAAIFVRNTIFDTWGFTAPALTVTNAAGVTTPAPKPVEHQNEIVGSLGGQIPFTHKKGFFFATYDRFHSRNGINPSSLTIPTLAMRNGDFSQLLQPNVFNPNGPTGCTGTTVKCQPIGQIYDPTTTAACSAANGTYCRNPYPNNQIPTAEISPIAQKMQSFLPTPSNAGISGNYLGGVPTGYDNWEFATRLDFDLTQRQRLSYVLTIGTRKNVPFTVGGSPAGVVLPIPYTAGSTAIIKPTVMDVEHTWTIRDNLVNQFKYGYSRFAQPVGSLTENVAPYRAAADFGITNLPAGQAADEFPGASFGATTTFGIPETTWTSAGASGATGTTVPNTYTMLDNLQWVKGKHALTLGGQIQWLQDNVAAQAGPSGIFTTAYDANSTASFPTNAAGVTSPTLSTAYTGFSYASYLLGAVPSSNVAIQGVSETGGRYRDMSPYVQDDWKITPKLTVNLGLRWDYLPPYHEVEDRWSFLNPNIVNTATGNLGALQYAGNRGAGVSCQCRTPVNTWWKNYGPRVGFAYAVTPTTVIRGGYALVYSLGGGVGGRGGAGTGTGATGFNVSATTPAQVTTGTTAGPSYYLNNSQAFTAAGLANTAYGGPGYVLPTPTAPSTANQTLNTGNYLNAAGAYVTASTMAYADPYLSSRAPEFSFYNGGIQQSLTKDLTLTLNYAGTQSHFVAASGSNGRGYWSNQLNPTYLAALGNVTDSTGATPLLSAQATPANVAILQAKMPTAKLPYASISSTNSKTTTIAQTLVAFPQYSGVTDTWGDVSNFSYNALQASLAQRLAHGVSFTINYTWSKNVGDDGTFRSGYDLPSGATSNGKSYKANRIDRAETVTNIPQNISFYGVYQSPFGKNKLAGGNKWVSAIAGGWQLSNIYTYTSGAPIAITYAGCTTPLVGQCMPDVNPNYVGSPRINGAFGSGIKANALSAKQYIDPKAFMAPNNYGAGATPITKIGDAPRTAPYGMHAPGKYNLDLSLRRTFNLTPERLRLVLEADGLNITNHPTFGTIGSVWSTAANSTFGTVGSASGNRDFQFAGRVNF